MSVVIKQFIRLIMLLFGVYLVFMGANGVFVKLNPPNMQELLLITQTIYPYPIFVYVVYIIVGIFVGVLALRWWYNDFQRNGKV